MREQQVKYGRIAVKVIALGVLLLLVLFGTSRQESFSLVQVISNVFTPNKAESAPRHKYVLLNALSADRNDGIRVNNDFQDVVRKKWGSQLQIDPKSGDWPGTQFCREKDKTCDRIYIDLDNRQLRIWCPELQDTDKKDAVRCPRNLSRSEIQDICMKPLPGELTGLLKAHADWKHGGN